MSVGRKSEYENSLILVTCSAALKKLNDSRWKAKKTNAPLARGIQLVYDSPLSSWTIGIFKNKNYFRFSCLLSPRFSNWPLLIFMAKSEFICLIKIASIQIGYLKQ